MSELHLATRCIHAGQAPDPTTGAVVAPIHQSTTYAQPSPGVYERYDYSRAGNPTRTTLEDCLASLEGGPGAAAFSSGMAAISALMHMLPGGAHVVCGANVYGGTFRVFDKVYAPMGYRFSYVDTRDLEAVEKVLEDDVALVFLETPTNPLMHVTDVAAICKRARAKGAKVVVDNTFMTPVFQRPLELGADYVVHSGTKYLGGHSDVVIGFVVPRDAAELERLRFVQKCVGAIPAPMESWLCLRGLKTLAVRMQAHVKGARRVAEHLVGHAAVQAVHYPGLADHPGHEVQMRQASECGGAMVSFELQSAEAARNFCEQVELFTLAESLGAVESLVCVPSLMTHASVPPEQRAELGLHDGLVRISVGIEAPEDLLAELERLLHTLA